MRALYLFAKEFFKGAIKPIIISSDVPKYSQKFKSDSPIIINKLKKILLLGKFNPSSKEITLYIENIRVVANETSLDPSILLGSVYIHELIHAFFDNDSYNELKFLEEPIAEFGSIVFIRDYLIWAGCKNSNKVVLSLRDRINDKKNNPAISFYGYGADLYDRFENKELKELLDIIKRFKKFSLSREDHSILDKYDRLWKSGDLNCHNKEEMDFKDLLFRIIQ